MVRITHRSPDTVATISSARFIPCRPSDSPF
jgi:hypothetical protein